MRKIKVIEVIEAYEFDIEMLRADKKNSNRSKLIQRDELMLQFLRTVPKDLYLSCEGTATDSAKLNAGSLTECILNYHLAKEPVKEVALMLKLNFPSTALVTIHLYKTKCLSTL